MQRHQGFRQKGYPMCELCDSSEKVEEHVGGPVHFLCEKCDTILKKFFKLKDEHDKWRGGLKNLKPVKIDLGELKTSKKGGKDER